MRKKNLQTVMLGAAILVLAGCSSQGTFRNREMDYLRVPVQQTEPLKTPPGMTPAKADPAFVIPPGQDQFAPNGTANLKPPGFNEVYVYTPPKKRKAPTVKQEPVKKASATATLAQPQEAIAKPKAVSPAVLPPQLVSHLITTDDMLSLEVEAPLQTVWPRVGQALQRSGYEVVDQNESKGFYFLAPPHEDTPGHIVLLSLTKQEKNTQLMVYDVNGELTTAPWAQALLKHIAMALEA